MRNYILSVIKAHKQGLPVGIYSVCSANPYVLHAAMAQAEKDKSTVLIEATSNQVNQFGGYTGMTPRDFRRYISRIAKSRRFDSKRVILGGDHLGPQAWKDEPASVAMEKAENLVSSFVEEGFTKIHLDTSMPCSDDTLPLAEEIISERTARLALVAEEAYARSSPEGPAPVYVIGTEVPSPGGALESMDTIHITTVQDAEQAVLYNQKAFQKQRLDNAWERVIALVVQPGVEFGDTNITEYDRSRASGLSQWIAGIPRLVFEAHSTDYQTLDCLKQMVEDHFSILKVGPALTYAFREGVFALAAIESEWFDGKKGITLSRIREVLEKVMLERPEYWQKHYSSIVSEQALARKYSYSDRIRYYWFEPSVESALNQLFKNLSKAMPASLVSQFLPVQYQRLRAGILNNHPIDFLQDKIMDVTAMYSTATAQDKHSYLFSGEKE